MKPFLVLFIVCVLFNVSAFAQDVITIIDEDGKAQSIDITAPKRPEAPPSLEDVIDKTIASPEAPSIDAVPEKPVVETMPKDLPETASKLDLPAEKKSVPLTKSEPKETPPKVQEPQAPQKAVQANQITGSKRTKQAKPDVKKAIMVKPRRKPVRSVQEQNSIVDGRPIAQNTALSIAINEAPPSNDFQIYRSFQGDAPIYQILFKTDQGFYEVQIDAFEGQILFSDYRDDLDTYITPKPGHLPKGWQ